MVARIVHLKPLAMFNLPSLKVLKGQAELAAFARRYENISGLAVSTNYLSTVGVQVFGFYLKDKLIGGFLLGTGDEFRSVQLFARAEQHASVYHKMGLPHHYTEICCLWLTPRARQQRWVNLACWVKFTVALQLHASQYLLFGTCSWGLAALYASSRKSMLIHEDLINNRPTYIFVADKKSVLPGMGNVIWHKVTKMFHLMSPGSIRLQKRLRLAEARI